MLRIKPEKILGNLVYWVAAGLVYLRLLARSKPQVKGECKTRLRSAEERCCDMSAQRIHVCNTAVCLRDVTVPTASSTTKLSQRFTALVNNLLRARFMAPKR